MDADWDNDEQFPWQVSIKCGTRLCSGVAIHLNWVLTSASCVKQASRYEVRVGSVLHYTGGIVKTSHIAYIHPYFNETNNQNNIALIYTEPSHIANNRIIPGLPSDMLNSNLNDHFALVSGWGRLCDSQLVSPVLQYASGHIIRNTSAECRFNWNGTAIGRNDILCAVFRRQHGCAGDTGSPLIVKVKSIWYLAGIAVFNSASYCDQSTSLFTPFFTFREWMDSVFRNAKF